MKLIFLAWLYYWRLCSANHPVLLVVLDGLRHDYLSAYSTPNLDRLVSQGVLVPLLEPEFPAARDPFLVSLLTGQHTSKHGIFANRIFFEDSQTVGTLETPAAWKDAQLLPSLWDLEPRFCTCNWPHAHHLLGPKKLHLRQKNILDGRRDETAAEIKEASSETKANVTAAPDESLPANSTIATSTTLKPSNDVTFDDFKPEWENCIDAIVSRLTHDDGNGQKQETRFASVYLPEPGQSAMTFGPESDEVRETIGKVDEAIGGLLDRLSEKALWPNKLNLIVTSAPGYAELSPSHLIDLGSLVSEDLFVAVGESPVLNIRPLKKELFVYEELRKGEKTSPFKVYIKEEFPAECHYASNENVQELIVVADEGFAFSSDMKDRLKELDARANRSSLALKNLYGLSGYNHSLSSMQTLVIAQGPDLADGGKLITDHKDDETKRGEQPQRPLRVVDLFALLCNLLEVDLPAETAADSHRVLALLKYPSDTKVVKVIRNWLALALMPQNVPITLAVGVTSVTFLVVLIIVLARACCCQGCCHRRGGGKSSSAKLGATSYRYSQVKTNRRPTEDDVDVQFEGMADDKQGLLSEVPINEEDEEEA